MRSYVGFTAAALTAAGALCATLPSAVGTASAKPAHRPDACFYLNQVQNSRLLHDRTLLIRTSGDHVYRMEFAGDCSDMGTEPVILHPFNNEGAGQICQPIELDVRIRGTGQICNPRSLERLTPAQVAAIPAGDRP